jgi:hypothetical protein
MRLGSGKAGWESGENNDISGMVASSCWGFPAVQENGAAIIALYGNLKNRAALQALVKDF